VRKAYEAVAPHVPGLELPRTVRSRIVKERGVLTAQEVPGPVNAETHVALAGVRAGLARYRLVPTTGAPTSSGCTWPGSACRSWATTCTRGCATWPPTTSAARCSCSPPSWRSPTPSPGGSARSPRGCRLQAWDDPAGWAGPAAEPARAPVSS
jgi:tRNA pseudouridine32 synthase/23S rRNA pseudouridine746 synthase